MAQYQSRRDFLKRGSLTLAGAMAVSQGAIAVNTAPKKVRIGVVGGGFGTSFQWHEHPDCQVRAVSDLREDRRKRLMQVYNCPKAYNSLEELVLAKDIDAVAIFTDGPLHVQHTVEAMKNFCRARRMGNNRAGRTAAGHGEKVRPDLHDG